MNRTLPIALFMCVFFLFACATAPEPVPESDASIQPVNVINYYSQKDIIFIKATMNDIPDEVAIIISICQGTYFYHDSALRLGLPQIPANPPNWQEGDRQFFSLGEPLTFRQNKWYFCFHNFYTTDKKSINIEHDGILGDDAFRPFILTIDPVKHQLRNYDKNSGQTQAESVLPGAMVMNTGMYNNSNNMIAIDTTIDEQKPLRLYFDTIFYYYPGLTMKTAKRLGFSTDSPNVVTWRIKISDNRIVEYHLFRVNSFKIGSYDMGPTIFYVDEGGSLDGIGMKTMDNFRITIDYQQNKMVLVPLHKKPKPVSFVKYGIGFSDQDGKIIINSFCTNSAGLEAGLQYGDEVLKLNDTPVQELGLKTFSEKINSSDCDKMRLTIRSVDGTVRTVKLKKRDLFRKHP